MNNIKAERQEKIVEYLRVNHFAVTLDLMELVNYSEATIKRDLVELEKQGLVRRTRGGAMIIDAQKIDIPYLMKMSNLEVDKSKQQLAKEASKFLRDDMVLFMDSSSTCLQLLNYLNHYQGLHVVTNGILTAFMVSEYTNATVSVLGGTLVPQRATINSSKTYRDIMTYNCDVAFVSCRGFNFEKGASENQEGEALIKKAFREQSETVILLVTQEKFHKVHKNQSLSPPEIDVVISDRILSESETMTLECKHITYIGVE